MQTGVSPSKLSGDPAMLFHDHGEAKQVSLVNPSCGGFAMGLLTDVLNFSKEAFLVKTVKQRKVDPPRGQLLGDMPNSMVLRSKLEQQAPFHPSIGCKPSVALQVLV